MKIVLGLPPFEDPRGIHQVQSNRQYQVFHHRAFIFPYMGCYAATMLKNDGHEVLWLDGEAEGLTWKEYEQKVKEFQPDIVTWEAKTPSIIKTWEAARKLKKFLPSATIIIYGDHVTALPEETLEMCGEVDIVITGGDYDFGLTNIIKALESGKSLTLFPNFKEHK